MRTTRVFFQQGATTNACYETDYTQGRRRPRAVLLPRLPLARLSAAELTCARASSQSEA